MDGSGTNLYLLKGAKTVDVSIDELAGYILRRIEEDKYFDTETIDSTRVAILDRVGNLSIMDVIAVLEYQQEMLQQVDMDEE